ncbi:MAG TPA: PrsW family glutamic-type intramembrane protease [Ktedonobacterales bacterium]
MGLLTSRKSMRRAAPASLALNDATPAALRVMPPAAVARSGSVTNDEEPQLPRPIEVHPTAPTVPLANYSTPEDALDGDQGIVYPVTLPVTTIGRATENMVSLLDPMVSRRHALLLLDARGWLIENVTQSNPLWVGGEQVEPGDSARVTPGQVIQLGRSRLQLLAPLGLPLPRSSTPPEQFTAEPRLRSPFNPLNPGVTLQFALRGRMSRSAGWTLLTLAVVVFVASALLTLDVAALAGQAALASGGLRQALTAIAIPLAPALGVALVVGALDRYEREPLVTLVGAFLWGALIAIPPALYIEGALSNALEPLTSAFTLPGMRALAQAASLALTAGGVEEVVKGAGLIALLLALRDEFDNVTDGVIYGALIGAGFAMVENIVYFAAAPRSELGFLIIGRIALGWLSHSVFTAVFGAGLGYIRETRDLRMRWLAPLGGLLAAIALHTYFDFVVYITTFARVDAPSSGLGALARLGSALPVIATLAIYVPVFLTALALLNVTLQAHRREAATVRVYLAPEILTGVVTPDEYLLAQDARLRSVAEHDYGLRYGLRAYLLARSLFQTETGLAFRKWHVEMGDPPKRADRQPEDAYRERIPRLRRALSRAAAPLASEPAARDA